MTVGRIEPSRDRIPTVVPYRLGRLSGSPPIESNLAAPDGVRVGDTMIAFITAGGFGGGGENYVMTPDPAWSTVYEDPDGIQIIMGLYTKVADQDDEDGVTTYSWEFTMTGGNAGMNVILVALPQRFGTVVSDPDVTHSSTPSLASPGGRWQIAYIAQRSSNAFADPGYPDPVVTSTRATLLVENVDPTSPGGQWQGNVRIYASANTSPITGAYLQTTINFPVYGMVVAAVT